MNYQEVYNRIVYDPKNNLLTKNDGIEVHHIMPKSLGGSEESENKVKLTYRQHFVCHWLLWKLSKGDQKIKMCHAFNRMVYGQQGKYVKINSTTYAKLKIAISQIRSDQMKGKRYSLGRKRSKEECEAISKSLLGNQRGKGYKQTPEQLQAKSERQRGKSHKGYKHSSAANLAKSLRQKGKPNPKAAQKLIGNKYGLGYKFTDEQRKNSSEAKRRRYAIKRRNEGKLPKEGDDKYI